MPDEMDLSAVFDLGTSTMSLGDILGIKLESVEEVRGGRVTPTGVYEFEVSAEDIPALVQSTYADKETGEPKTSLKVRIMAKIVAIAAMEGHDDPEEIKSWLNFKHIEYSFPISTKEDLLRDIGRVKAIAIDAGFIDKRATGDINTLFQSFAGKRFIAAVICKQSKNNPDYFNSRINERKVSKSGMEEIPG